MERGLPFFVSGSLSSLASLHLPAHIPRVQPNVSHSLENGASPPHGPLLCKLHRLPSPAVPQELEGLNHMAHFEEKAKSSILASDSRMSPEFFPGFLGTVINYGHFRGF